MRKLIFIFFLFPILLNAQVYKTGDILPYYYDINPDTLINFAPSWKSYKMDSAYIYIFNGLSPDFKIESVSLQSYTGGSDLIHIVPMNVNAFIGWGRTDSVCGYFGWPTPSYWCWVTNVVKPLQFGDTINNPLLTWTNQDLYLIDKSPSFAGPSKNVQDFVSVSDKYISVKYQSSTDTAYGWIRVQCPDIHNCYVKDFSASKSYVGIKELNKVVVSIYPNPTNDKVEFVLSNQSSELEIRLYNSLGQIVLEDKKANTSKFNLDVSNYANGLYYVEVKSKEGISRAKFVKN